MKKMDKKFRRLSAELEAIYANAKAGTGPYQDNEHDWRDVYSSLRSYWTQLRSIKLPRSGFCRNLDWVYSKPHWANARSGRRMTSEGVEIRFIEDSNCARTVRVRKRRAVSRPERRVIRYIQALNAEIWECWNKTA